MKAYVRDINLPAAESTKATKEALRKLQEAAKLKEASTKRPRKLHVWTDEECQKYAEMHEEGMSWTKIARQEHMSPTFMQRKMRLWLRARSAASTDQPSSGTQNTTG